MKATFGNRPDPSSPDNIDLVTAKKMVYAYHSHSKKLTVEDNTGEDQTLRALVIDKKSMDELRDLDADEYMILFAVRKNDVDEPEGKQKFTTILAAVKDGKIMSQDLKNRFKPCPSDCNNYEVVFDEILK
ncbi:MAG: hypothetical protein JKY48_10275 [Flavobacteriales bacterium]|nr:hypothetical protein [Flavobacteriales bacterium]